MGIEGMMNAKGDAFVEKENKDLLDDKMPDLNPETDSLDERVEVDEESMAFTPAVSEIIFENKEREFAENNPKFSKADQAYYATDYVEKLQNGYAAPESSHSRTLENLYEYTEPQVDLEGTELESYKLEKLSELKDQVGDNVDKILDLLSEAAVEQKEFRSKKFTANVVGLNAVLLSIAPALQLGKKIASNFPETDSFAQISSYVVSTTACMYLARWIYKSFKNLADFKMGEFNEKKADLHEGIHDAIVSNEQDDQ